MNKRVIAFLLALVLCIGLMPAQSFATEQTVTRVEWIQALVAACSMTVEEDACPDNYFSDISAEDDFYRDVIVAVEFGLIDTEVGLAFEPNEPATREFVAHTLNAALMYQLPEGTAYTYSEAETVTYPDDIQVALNLGWFTLTEGAFLPEQALTATEMTAILESVAQILAASELDENHEDSYTFAEGVKVIEDAEDVYLPTDGQVVIVGSETELAVGDVFVVWLMDIPNAFEAAAVAVEGETVTVTVNPMAIENVVTSMDVQGQTDVDLAYFEPAEGCEVIYEFEDGTETTSATYARSKPKKVKSIHETIEIPFDNTTFTVTVSLTKMKAQYELEIFTNQRIMFRLDGNARVTASVEADLLGLTGLSDSIFLGGIDYGIGQAGVYAVFKVDGTCTLTLGGDFTVGVEASDVYGLRNLSQFNRKEFSLVTELSMKAGLQVKANMKSMGVSAHAYFEMGAKANVRNIRAENRNCLDIVAFPYAEVDSGFSADFIIWKDSQSSHYDILKEGDTPKIHEHYEDGLHVLECHFGDISCNGWRGGWNQFNLGGLVNSSSSTYSSGSPAKLYDYTLDEVNRATITKYYGSASSLFVPKTLDGYEVIAIGNDAFNGNSYLRNVTVPDNITAMGSGVFANCKNLHTVKLSAALTAIPNYAFQNTALVTVSIPDTVTYLGRYAFQGCTRLLNVDLSNTLTTIGEDAFRGCTSLETITLPKSLTSTDYYHFGGYYGIFCDCPNLKEVILEDGITTIPAYLFWSANSLETIHIPSTVTSIQGNAFRDAKGLVSIVIPDSVTTLGASVFEGCSNLETITLSQNTIQMGNYIFYGCSSLDNVILPDSITYIPRYAFQNCTSLTDITLSPNLTTIGEDAFRGCTSLETITLPKSLTSTDYYHFGGYYGIFCDCPNLKEVILEEGITTIPAYLFWSANSLETIQIPSTVTSIQGNAFRDAKGFTSIVIPDSVTTLGASVFEGCSNLETITLSQNTIHMGYYLFLNCSNLNNVVLPDSITYIPRYAFQNCTSLTDITLSPNLTTIGEDAFRGCTSLETITLPKSLTSTDYYHFGGYYGIFCDCPNLKEVILEEGITTIPAYLFWSANSLETIQIPSTVTSIQGNAFREAKGLTSIVIPDSVATMGNEVFINCVNLETVTLSQNLTQVSNNTFDGCTSLDNVVLPENITLVNQYAFRNCSAMTNITLSPNLTTIGQYAFQGCSELLSINIPEKVTSLGNACFENCTDLVTATIPGSIKTIPVNAFRNCDALLEINIPNGVTTIQATAFYDCDALVTVTMADTVTTMETGVFTECGALKNVTLSQWLTTIPNNTFYRCGELETIVIPYRVTTIGASAFADSPKLTKVVLYSNVTSIDSTAFSYKGTTLFYGPDGSNAQTWLTNNSYKFNINEVTVTDVTLPETAISIAKSTTYNLCPMIAPMDAAYDVIYKSSDEAVVTVDASGKIKAVGVGAASVKITAGGQSVSVKVTVTQAVTKISINKTSLDLDVPETYQLTVSITPTDASNQVLSWTSSNEAAATVDENGLVTAVGNGTSVITATTADGSDLSVSCTVVVIEPDNIPVSNIQLNVTTAELEAMDQLQLSATITPTDAANQVLDWSSSDEKVATVDENGLVTAVGKGTAIITGAATDDSGISASCTVTVVNNGYLVADVEELESSHNYEDSCTDFWIYTDPGASSLLVSFDMQTHMEEDFDFLMIYDGQNNLIGQYTGSQLAGATVEIEGTTVKLQMLSDNNGNEWGFKVAGITRGGCPHDYTAVITAPTCTEDGFTTYICELCYHSYVYDVVPATGHNYVDGRCTGCKEIDPTFDPPGDANGDGMLNVIDVARIYAYIKGNHTPEEALLDDYDVNGDGTVNISDVAVLYAHIKGVNLIF